MKVVPIVALSLFSCVPIVSSVNYDSEIQGEEIQKVFIELGGSFDPISSSSSHKSLENIVPTGSEVAQDDDSTVLGECMHVSPCNEATEVVDSFAEPLTEEKVVERLREICAEDSLVIFHELERRLGKEKGKLYHNAALLSAELGSLKIFEYLVAKFASVRTIFRRYSQLEKYIPLTHQIACAHNQPAILQFIDTKYPSYRDMSTSLLQALAFGHASILETYLWNSETGQPRRLPRQVAQNFLVDAILTAINHDQVNILETMLLRRQGGKLLWPLQNKSVNVNQALVSAAVNKRTRIFQILSRQFWDVKVQSMVLLAIVEGGNLDILKYLVKEKEQGISPFDNITLDYDNNAAFRLACQLENLEMAQFLIDGHLNRCAGFGGIDPASKDNLAIVEAFQFGRKAIYEYLITLKPQFPKLKLEARNYEAFIRAARLCDSSHLRYFLTTVNNVPKETLSRALVEAVRHQSQDSIEYLMSLDALVTLDVVAVAAQVASPDLPHFLEKLREQDVQLVDSQALEKKLASRGSFYTWFNKKTMRGRGLAKNPVMLAAVKSRDIETITTIFQAIYGACPNEKLVEEIAGFVDTSSGLNPKAMIKAIATNGELRLWESRALSMQKNRSLRKWALGGITGVSGMLATVLVVSTVSYDFYTTTYYYSLLQSLKDSVAPDVNIVEYLSGLVGHYSLALELKGEMLSQLSQDMWQGAIAWGSIPLDYYTITKTAVMGTVDDAIADPQDTGLTVSYFIGRQLWKVTLGIGHVLGAMVHVMGGIASLLSVDDAISMI